MDGSLWLVQWFGLSISVLYIDVLSTSTSVWLVSRVRVKSSVLSSLIVSRSCGRVCVGLERRGCFVRVAAMDGRRGARPRLGMECVGVVKYDWRGWQQAWASLTARQCPLSRHDLRLQFRRAC